MAPHSSTLAWEIPQTEKPGGLQSIGSQRVRHDLATEPPPYICPLSLILCLNFSSPGGTPPIAYEWDPKKTQLPCWRFGRNRRQEHRKPSVNGHCIFSPARFQLLSLGDIIHEKTGAFRFLTDCFIYQTEVPRLNSQCLHFLTLGCLYANICRYPQAVPLVLFCLHSLHDWHVASAIFKKKQLTWKCVMYVMCISVEKYLQISNILTSM